MPTHQTSAATSPSQERRGQPANAVKTRRINSQDLFGNTPFIEIEHRSQVYRLTQTAMGKLILTK